jgi:hypothetical protein
MENCIFINKEISRGNRRYYKRKDILSYTQIDDRYIVIEVSDENKYITCDMENNNTLSVVSDNRDYQILLTLSHKYNVANQFADFSSKIL